MNHLFTFENKSSLFDKCGSMTIRCWWEHSQYNRKLVLLLCTILIAKNGLNKAIKNWNVRKFLTYVSTMNISIWRFLRTIVRLLLFAFPYLPLILFLITRAHIVNCYLGIVILLHYCNIVAILRYNISKGDILLLLWRYSNMATNIFQHFCNVAILQ